MHLLDHFESRADKRKFFEYAAGALCMVGCGIGEAMHHDWTWVAIDGAAAVQFGGIALLQLKC